MDPLSPWTYARRNVRKILPTLIILTFVVMLVVVMLTALRGLKESALVYTRQFDSWTVLFPKASPQLSEETLDVLRAREEIDRVIVARSCYVRMKALIGYVPFRVYGVKQDEMTYMLERCGAERIAGRLPAEGTAEVALHEQIMKANEWAIGTEFGMDVNEDDWMPGRFKVVGILRGPAPVGVASFAYLNSPLYRYAPKLWERVLVAPREGRMAAMNEFVRELEDVKSWDKARAVHEVSLYFDRILLILDFISIVLIAVIAIVVGLIHNIFFAQRMEEFAVLLAIGFTKRTLIRKVTAETAGIMIVAWGGGLALGTAMLAAFREGFLEPRGIYLPMTQAAAILVSAALPLVALLFAGFTVFGRLKRLDPVTILERRG